MRCRLLLLSLVVGGCSDQLAPLKAEWQATVGEGAALVLSLMERQQRLGAQAEALPLLEDTGSKPAIAQRQWLEDLSEAAEEISDIEEKMSAAEPKVKKVMAEGTLAELQAVVAQERKELLAEERQAQQMLDQVANAFGAVRTAVEAQAALEQAAAKDKPAWVRAVRRAVEGGGKVQVPEVAFVGGKSELDLQSADNLKGLEALAAALKDCAGLKVRITGHTSSEGDAKANEKLSLARADALKKFLVSRGVKKEALRTYGVGSAEPWVPEPSAAEAKAMGAAALKAHKAKNRRLTFEVTSRCQ